MAEEPVVAVEEETEKRTAGGFLLFVENHPKTIFLMRAIAWFMFAGGLPFAFIAWRYGIFKNVGTIEISGWGLIGVVILAIVVITLVKYIHRGMKPSMLKQCVSGFVSIIIPLLVVLVIINGIKNNIALFEQALGCTIICELIAIPVNPFPAWIEERKKADAETKVESMADIVWEKFFQKKKDKE